MGEKERMTVKIDSEAKKELKIIALRKGTTMSEIIEDEVKRYVKENSDLL